MFRIGSGKGGSGDSIPSPFSYKLSADGEKLELWYNEQMIAVQSKDGSWFSDNISTGVGSLHLGGDYSGGLAHSVSSTGQNVGFKNEFSRAFPEDRIMFFPCWQGLSVDNDELIPPSYLSFSAKTTSTPNGSVHASSVVDYNFNLTASTNFVTTKVSFWPAENYTGKLKNVIISTINNVEIYSTTTEVTLNSGIVSSIDYQYPFFLRQGDTVRLQLIKEDGSYLRTRAGITNSSQPWRQLNIRTYVDMLIAPANGYSTNRVMVSNSSGNLVVNPALTGSRILATSSSGLLEVTNVTKAQFEELNQGFRKFFMAQYPSTENNYTIVSNYKGFDVTMRVSPTYCSFSLIRLDGLDLNELSGSIADDPDASMYPAWDIDFGPVSENFFLGGITKGVANNYKDSNGYKGAAAYEGIFSPKGSPTDVIYVKLWLGNNDSDEYMAYLEVR